MIALVIALACFAGVSIRPAIHHDRQQAPPAANVGALP